MNICEYQRLLDMGFATYENKELCKEHVVVKNIQLEKGKVDNVDVVTNNSLSILRCTVQRHYVKSQCCATIITT